MSTLPPAEPVLEREFGGRLRVRLYMAMCPPLAVIERGDGADRLIDPHEREWVETTGLALARAEWGLPPGYPIDLSWLTLPQARVLRAGEFALARGSGQQDSHQAMALACRFGFLRVCELDGLGHPDEADALDEMYRLAPHRRQGELFVGRPDLEGRESSPVEAA